jgi:hypothetical protein
MSGAPIRWHPMVQMAPMTLDGFHEWSVRFAEKKFATKGSYDPPITFFILWRGDTVHTMEAEFDHGPVKHRIFDTMRMMCDLDHNITMLSFISEVWVARVPVKDGIPALEGQVRDMPGREDGLMVSTFDRAGGGKVTKWVAKLKPNPDDNRLLARDDLDLSKETMVGNAMWFFEPEARDVP